MHIVTASFVLGSGMALAGGNWPGWRGPEGTGVSPETGAPVAWSAAENVRWKAALPGPGNSSPIVWGDRVFLTQWVRTENRRTVMCFDRSTRKLLWQAGPTYAEPEPTQRDNPYCSATPATDGERVIASFGSAGLYSYDFEGKELWHRDFGKMVHVFGNASSPILWGELCILPFGPDEKARVVAVKKRTGETAWEIEPPKPDPSEIQARETAGAERSGSRGGPPGFGGARGPGEFPRGGSRSPSGGDSWSTPIAIRAGDRDELVVAFPYRLAAYDPKTGRQLWFAKGLGGSIYATPLFGEGTIVAVSGDRTGGTAIAVRPGGSGDVTGTHRLWIVEDMDRQIGSGAIHDGRVYFVGQDASILCFDLKSGKEVWRQRLRAAERGRGGSWSSVLVADRRIYVPTQTGTVFVLKPGPEPEILAANPLGERTNASLALSNGELFIRTDANLWCLGEK